MKKNEKEKNTPSQLLRHAHHTNPSRQTQNPPAVLARSEGEKDTLVRATVCLTDHPHGFWTRGLDWLRGPASTSRRCPGQRGLARFGTGVIFPEAYLAEKQKVSNYPVVPMTTRQARESAGRSGKVRWAQGRMRTVLPTNITHPEIEIPVGK